MQHSANTPLFSRMRACLRALSARPAAAETYSVFIRGQGVAGHYATAEQAENALCRLPYALRQRATILDGDGDCVCR